MLKVEPNVVFKGRVRREPEVAKGELRPRWISPDPKAKAACVGAGLGEGQVGVVVEGEWR